MKSLLFYLLQVVIASGILYAYYHLMLRNKKFHQYNRFYLLIAVCLSILVPFLNIPVYFTASAAQSSVVLKTLQDISLSSPENPVVASSATVSAFSSTFDWNIVWYLLYSTAALLFILRVVVSFKKIKNIIKNNSVEDLEGIRFVNTDEPGTPYSFFRWLFWNKRIELRSARGEQIFRHEIYHIQQRHSLDIMMMELLTAIAWINPFFHLMKKELKTIHEFLADQFAANENEKWQYAELLLMQALNTQQRLVNPFFHNQIKRRIAMITNPQKTSYRYLRKLLVLPVAAILITLFAFKYKNRSNDPIAQADKPVTIVVDAGHGGIDPGAISPDGKYRESDLALAIAKKIQKLSEEYHVKVVMTRTDDQLPGNVATKEEGLKMRVAISEVTQPDAFLSIHMNADVQNASAKKGFEAYVAGQREDQAAKVLASAILQNISSLYPVNDKPMQKHEAGVYVLDKNSFPSLILECGYITNKDDLEFINNQENQEKVARNILESIVKFKNHEWQSAAMTVSDTLPHPFVKRTMFFSAKDTPVKKIILYNRQQFMIEDGSTEIKSHPNTSNTVDNTFTFRQNRQDEVAEIKAIARTERKAAYEYKGRTYVFGKIDKNNPELSEFTEQDGTNHVFLLNGELVTSIQDINKRFSRDDIKNLGLISPTEATGRFNRNESIVSIDTYSNGLITKNK